MSHFSTLAFLMNYLSTKDVNVARFARNVECDFFYNFQTLCVKTSVFASLIRPETN